MLTLFKLHCESTSAQNPLANSCLGVINQLISVARNFPPRVHCGAKTWRHTEVPASRPHPPDYSGAGAGVRQTSPESLDPQTKDVDGRQGHSAPGPSETPVTTPSRLPLPRLCFHHTLPTTLRRVEYLLPCTRRQLPVSSEGGAVWQLHTILYIIFPSYPSHKYTGAYIRMFV